MQIQVSVPGLLRDCTEGKAHFELEASTLDEAIKQLFNTYPLLHVHVYDEDGAVREHVLIYYNEDNIAWLERLDVQLEAGDRLAIVQAVSGG